MLKLLPSVLSADFANLGRDLASIKAAGATAVHVDVMDGTFVPSISLGFPVIRSMRKVSDLFFDVHLMVEEPGRYLEEVKKAGADRIGVHAEACKHLHRTLQQIRNLDCEVCAGGCGCCSADDGESGLWRTGLYSGDDTENP